MATYVMSDIHGEYDRFLRMLKLIRFSDSDHLYIIGDIIDRGSDGIDLALNIMRCKNVTLLRGNHEQMCCDALSPRQKFGAHQLWLSNGGGPTYIDLTRMRDKTTRETILRYFSELPLYLDIEVQSRKFHLVHGMPSVNYNEQDMLWGRPNPTDVSPWEGVTVIVGHTPTYFVDRSILRQESVTIWHGNGILDIDCGCGHSPPNRRLACLRLDDMEEIYL